MCDCVVAVGKERVLFGKNSDRDANEAQILEWHRRATHPEGASVHCTWIDIPQAPETYSLVLSRPYWMWGAEMGANEHGVVIGNEAVFTREPYAQTGLTGMDLLRLALERSSSAVAAVAVLVDLLERHGQGGGCGHENRAFTYHNSFLIADPHNAWVLETAGRRWADEQVVCGVRSISNGLTIAGFAERYGDRLRTTVSASRARRAQTSLLPANAQPQDVMALLRSHGARQWPRYSPINGALGAPCVHPAGLLTSSQTTASLVADLRPERRFLWLTATAAPCTSLYKPVEVDHPVDLGPLPDDHYDERTLWWRHERFQRQAMRDPPRLFPLFTTERDNVELDWLAEPPDTHTAFNEADALLERWTATVSAEARRDRRPWWVRDYFHARDERAAAREQGQFPQSHSV